MTIVWGVVIVLVSLPCWFGQVLSLLSPTTAERWKLTESEASVDPILHADGRGEALWDTFTLWVLPLAGVLLVLDLEAWAYFGLFGGGMYLYFGGRGVATRLAIARRGGRVGDADYLRMALVALVVWAVTGMLVAAGSVAQLAGW